MDQAVLLVDDSQTILDMLKLTLEQLGIPKEGIFTASNPKDALAAFATKKPTVVFMDLDLGGSPGEKVALDILKQKPSTKVIVMTGYDRKDVRVRDLVSAGAYEYLEKPIRVQRLQELVDLLDSESKGLRRVK